jgi:hypothetical protein
VVATLPSYKRLLPLVHGLRLLVSLPLTTLWWLVVVVVAELLLVEHLVLVVEVLEDIELAQDYL